MNRRAFVGIHNPDWAEEITGLFQMAGYEVLQAESADGLIGMIPRTPSEREYWVMDVNLGSPGERLHEPGERVYRAVKERVTKGYATFISITGHSLVEFDAKKAGIPCIDRANIFDTLKSI